jgi:hypothetical protein
MRIHSNVRYPAIYSVAAAALICLVAESHAASAMDRYNVILTRFPFGSAPVKATRTTPRPNPTPNITPQQLSFARNIRLCFIRDSGEGVRIGIADSKTKWSAVLRPGESEAGILLKDADYANGKALLEKEAVESWVYLDGRQPTTQTQSGRLSFTRSPSPPPSRPIYTPRTSRTRNVTHAALAAKERNRTRAAPTSPRQTLRGEQPPSTLTREEKQKKLREYNMELIRAGGAKGVPLPIPLTQEEDAQLVREGVLSAQ